MKLSMKIETNQSFDCLALRAEVKSGQIGIDFIGVFMAGLGRYSRPGGAAPPCDPTDASVEMIEAYRRPPHLDEDHTVSGSKLTPDPVPAATGSVFLFQYWI